MEGPAPINDKRLRFDAFTSDENTVFPDKKQRLPVMGWNSWNAFGSGNTEALTLEMVRKIKELGLDKLGYEYVVLESTKEE